MHRAIFAVSIGILLAFNTTAARAESNVASDWTLSTTDGATVVLSETVAEKPVILFFWATWCPFCKALMPHLQSIAMEYDDDVEILALHFRDDDGDPVAYIRDARYDFTLLRDVDDVAGQYDIWATPGVVIVDQDMQIQFNLYDLPRMQMPDNAEKMSHRQRAAILAPYWAAEIRKTIRNILDNQAK